MKIRATLLYGDGRIEVVNVAPAGTLIRYDDPMGGSPYARRTFRLASAVDSLDPNVDSPKRALLYLEKKAEWADAEPHAELIAENARLRAELRHLR